MPILLDSTEKPLYSGPVPGGHLKTNLYLFANLVKMMRGGYSPLIAIVGKQRVGKSLVALMIASKIAEIFGKKFVLDRWVYYEPLALLEGLKDDAAGEARIMDEAINIIHRREWFAQSHILLSKIISTQSYLNVVHIWCCPFRSDLDPAFEKYFDFLLHVTDKGHVKVWMFKKKHDAERGKECYKMFLDDLFFDKKDVPAEIWIHYEAWSKREKVRLLSKYTKKKKEDIELNDRIRAALTGKTDSIVRSVLDG